MPSVSRAPPGCLSESHECMLFMWQDGVSCNQVLEAATTSSSASNHNSTSSTNSSPSSISTIDLNSGEDCLHHCSSHFSPHHLPNLKGSRGEATSSHRHNRVFSRARGVAARSPLGPAEAGQISCSGCCSGTKVGHRTSGWANTDQGAKPE